MNHKRHPNSRLTPHSPNPGVNDLRILQLTARFPYMFCQADLQLAMRPEWIASFEILCASIDAMLGDNKQGFHWTSLHYEPTAFCWYWRVRGSLDACVGMVKPKHFSIFVLVHPTDKLESRMREVIAQKVQSAMEAALAIGCLYDRLQVKVAGFDKRSGS